jgi:hypothetical protein
MAGAPAAPLVRPLARRAALRDNDSRYRQDDLAATAATGSTGNEEEMA